MIGITGWDEATSVRVLEMEFYSWFASSASKCVEVRQTSGILLMMIDLVGNFFGD